MVFRNGEKRLDDPGVKLGASTATNLFACMRHRKGFAIRAVAQHRVESIGDRNDACPKRNLFPAQAAWVTCPWRIDTVASSRLGRGSPQGRSRGTSWALDVFRFGTILRVGHVILLSGRCRELLGWPYSRVCHGRSAKHLGYPVVPTPHQFPFSASSSNAMTKADRNPLATRTGICR